MSSVDETRWWYKMETLYSCPWVSIRTTERCVDSSHYAIEEPSGYRLRNRRWILWASECSWWWRWGWWWMRVEWETEAETERKKSREGKCKERVCICKRAVDGEEARKALRKRERERVKTCFILQLISLNCVIVTHYLHVLS